MVGPFGSIGSQRNTHITLLDSWVKITKETFSAWFTYSVTNRVVAIINRVKKPALLDIVQLSPLHFFGVVR